MFPLHKSWPRHPNQFCPYTILYVLISVQSVCSLHFFTAFLYTVINLHPVPHHCAYCDRHVICTAFPLAIYAADLFFSLFPALSYLMFPRILRAARLGAMAILCRMTTNTLTFVTPCYVNVGLLHPTYILPLLRSQFLNLAEHCITKCSFLTVFSHPTYPNISYILKLIAKASQS